MLELVDDSVKIFSSHKELPIPLWIFNTSAYKKTRLGRLRGCLGLLCSHFFSSAPAPQCQTHLLTVKLSLHTDFMVADRKFYYL
jgi:hypothetical protein